MWTELTTHFAHLDDLLALGFSVAALHAVARRHPVWAGLALAAAADAKPWAAAFVVLIFALPRRQWLTALGMFTGGVAVVWLPFLVADPRTLTSVTRFTIPNNRSSALRVLGVMTARTPWWDRSAQLPSGSRRARGGPARPLARGAAGRGGRADHVRPRRVRLLHVRRAARHDRGRPGADRWRFPWVTAVTAFLLYVARLTHTLVPFGLHQLGVLRLVFAIGVPVLVLGMPGWWIARRRGLDARAGDQVTIISPVRPAVLAPASAGYHTGHEPR